MLYTLLAERYERRSVMVTENLALSEGRSRTVREAAEVAAIQGHRVPTTA